MPYRRKQYAGAAVQTTIGSAMTAATPASLTIASNSGWPSGSDPFVVTVNPNQANEESCLVTISGTTITFVERGYDGTTAGAHDSGSAIIHSFDASSADQANRYVNLQAAKGDLVVHNGTNPVNLAPGFAGDGSDDGQILKSKNSEATGFEVAYPDVVNTDASAPTASSATKYGLWFDTTLYLMRTLVSGAWNQPNNVYAYASLAALNAAIATPRKGQVAQIGDDIVVTYDGTASAWRTVGTPRFADSTARDAFYGDASVGLYDGAKAKHEDDYSEWEYRQDEWIRRNAKITVSSSAPASPHDGDIWLQPVD